MKFADPSNTSLIEKKHIRLLSSSKEIFDISPIVKTIK